MLVVHVRSDLTFRKPYGQVRKRSPDAYSTYRGVPSSNERQAKAGLEVLQNSPNIRVVVQRSQYGAIRQEIYLLVIEHVHVCVGALRDKKQIRITGHKGAAVL
jgi:hypothetical protein